MPIANSVRAENIEVISGQPLGSGVRTLCRNFPLSEVLVEPMELRWTARRDFLRINSWRIVKAGGGSNPSHATGLYSVIPIDLEVCQSKD